MNTSYKDKIDKLESNLAVEKKKRKEMFKLATMINEELHKHQVKEDKEV